MIIWFALVIPVITAIVLYLFFNHYCRWWEFVIPFICSFLFVGLSKITIEQTEALDTEYWTGWVDHATYYEEWDELVEHEIEEEYYDSKGKKKIKKKKVKEVEYHPAEYYIVDSNDSSHSISSSEFHRLSNLFGNKKFHNMHRDYHKINGNKYTSHWPKNDDTLQVVSTSHLYKNKVAVSDSIFKFQPITPEEQKACGIFDYPRINDYHLPCILGYDDPEAERSLSLTNAKLGKEKQIRVWVLVYRNQSMEASMLQERHWQGGNKNELCICIGIDDEDIVQWGRVFSWAEKEIIKSNIRDIVIEQEASKVNLKTIVDKLPNEIRENWQRKHFKDFDYLTIEPPFWAVMLTFLMTLGINVGTSYWVIKNEF